MLNIKMYSIFKSETKPYMIVAYFRQAFKTLDTLQRRNPNAHISIYIMNTVFLIMCLLFVDVNNALLNLTRLLFKFILRKTKPSWSPGFEIHVHLHELGYKIFLELNLKKWCLCQMICFTLKKIFAAHYSRELSIDQNVYPFKDKGDASMWVSSEIQIYK